MNAMSNLQFTGYASLTVFHYTVPPEMTRATWEFASFQDHGDCPHRRVRIFLQHGSYPVFRSGNCVVCCGMLCIYLEKILQVTQFTLSAV